MTALTLWWNGTPVATVTESSNKMVMRYEPGAPMLSVAMPVRTQPYRERVARPFFHGLLPEGETRLKIAYDLGLGNDGGRDLALLGAIGQDCAGALVITPAGTTPPPQRARALEPLTDAEVAQRVRDLPDHPLGVDGRVRLSLPGVQNKLLLARTENGVWHLPIDGVPSTHILKPELRRWPGSVDNELFCQTVAHHAGVPAAETTRARFEDFAVLISTRFDRAHEPDGTVTRLHQEDACQALSVLTIPTERKYQTDPRKEPSFRGVAGILDRWANTGAREALLDQMIVNIVVGNADLHGKNITFLHRDGVVSLSPAYDIMSTTALRNDLTTTVGMYVGGATQIHQITATHLIDEGTSWGLRRNRVEAQISELLERLPAAVGAAADQYPDLPDALVAHVDARVLAAQDDFANRAGP